MKLIILNTKIYIRVILGMVFFETLTPLVSIFCFVNSTLKHSFPNEIYLRDVHFLNNFFEWL